MSNVACVLSLNETRKSGGLKVFQQDDKLNKKANKKIGGRFVFQHHGNVRVIDTQLDLTLAGALTLNRMRV